MIPPATAEPNPSRAGAVKRFIVYWLSAVAVGCLVVVTLGGASEVPIEQPPKAWRASMFHHGWPWIFSSDHLSHYRDSWFERRCVFWKSGSPWYKFHCWALVGDLLVMAAGIVVVVLLARRALRRPGWRVSLAQAAAALTLACVGCGYVGDHRRVSVQEARIEEQLEAVNAYTKTQYRGPRWLLQLSGDSGYFRGLFHHGTELVLRNHADARRAGVLVSELRYLRGVTMEGNVTCRDEQWNDLLRARPRWAITQIDLRNSRLTGQALVELNRCPRLRSLDMEATNIGDDGVHHLANCPELVDVWFSKRITDRGLKELPPLPKLEILGLDNSNITDRGLTELTRFPTLQVLYSDRTLVSAECIPTLRELPNLTRLWLQDCPCIPKSHRRQFEALPLKTLEFEK